MLNSWDRANIMKIIPTWPRVNLPRFHQTTLQDCSVQGNPEDQADETQSHEFYPVLFNFIVEILCLNIYIYILESASWLQFSFKSVFIYFILIKT